MNITPTRNPAPQVADPIDAVLRDIRTTFARHGIVRLSEQLSILTALLATSIAGAARQSSFPSIEAATSLAGHTCMILSREVENAMRPQGGIN